MSKKKKTPKVFEKTKWVKKTHEKIVNIIHMSPEERERHRKEILEILFNAKKEQVEEKRELTRRSRQKDSFTIEEIAAHLQGLKFKNEVDEALTTTNDAHPEPTTIEKFKDSGTIKKSPTSYEKWYKMVTEIEEPESVKETDKIKSAPVVEQPRIPKDTKQVDTKPENTAPVCETEVPLDVKIIKTIFDKKASSYKYFWFMSIISLAKENEILSIKYSDIIIRMAAMAWPIVFESEIDLGSRDFMKTYLEEVVRKTSLIKSASSNVVKNYLSQHYTSQGVNKILSPLLKNVPYRFLSPWIQYTTDEEVCQKSQDKHFTGLYALYKDTILLDEAWWKYISENYANVCAFTLKSFLQYVKPNNSEFQLLKLKTMGWPLVGNLSEEHI